MKRSQRRHHRARMIERAKKVQLRWWLGLPATEAKLHQAAVRLADNTAICSCACCGNPRRHEARRTRQELLAALTEREQIAEYFAGD